MLLRERERCTDRLELASQRGQSKEIASLRTVCNDKKMSVEEADRKFQESFQHIHKSNSIYHPDNHDSSLCEGHRNMSNSTKKDIVGFTETPDDKLEMMNIISLRCTKSGRTFRSVFVGYHNTNVKHGNLSDVVRFFDDMDSSSLKLTTRGGFAFEADANTKDLKPCIRKACWDEQSESWGYIRSGFILPKDDKYRATKERTGLDGLYAKPWPALKSARKSSSKRLVASCCVPGTSTT